MRYITFVSRFNAVRYVNEGCDVIAIRGIEDNVAHYNRTPKSYMELVIEDATDEKFIQQGRLFNHDDANAIREFLASTTGDVIVHCQAGMSRSAAVAKAIVDTRDDFEIVLDAPCIGHFTFVNSHIYNILVRELSK